MGAVTENNTIIIPRGDTARRSIEITIKDGDKDAELYEIKENDILTLRVKKNLADKEPCISKEIKGSSDFHFKPEDTENLHFGKYIYSVRLFTAEGDKYTVIDKNILEIAEVV